MPLSRNRPVVDLTLPITFSTVQQPMFGGLKASRLPRGVVATVYHAAGSDAIFNDNPFERRLRDIHAGTEQGQGRSIHFETVGQILLGLPPEGRMFR
jgi:Acyl-CoA dehydrogenase, C-terminal domain